MYRSPLKAIIHIVHRRNAILNQYGHDKILEIAVNDIALKGL